MLITAQTRIDDLLDYSPEIGNILFDLGLDFWNEQELTIEEQCIEKCLDIKTTIDAIRNFQLAEDTCYWLPKQSKDLNELIEHLIVGYHKIHFEEFKKIKPILYKVVKTEGDKFPQLLKIEEILLTLFEELAEHMQQEEDLLFPTIQLLMEQVNNQDQGELDQSIEDQVANLIENFECEHDITRFIVVGLEKLTNHYVAPEYSSQDLVSLYELLKNLSVRIKRHAFIEDEYLHPAVKNLLEYSLAS